MDLMGIVLFWFDFAGYWFSWADLCLWGSRIIIAVSHGFTVYIVNFNVRVPVLVTLTVSFFPFWFFVFPYFGCFDQKKKGASHRNIRFNCLWFFFYTEKIMDDSFLLQMSTLCITDINISCFLLISFVHKSSCLYININWYGLIGHGSLLIPPPPNQKTIQKLLSNFRTKVLSVECGLVYGDFTWIEISHMLTAFVNLFSIQVKPWDFETSGTFHCIKPAQQKVQFVYWKL